MVNTTILENKIEALTRRIAALTLAAEAMAQPRFKVGARYRLKCDILTEAHAHKGDDFMEGDIVRIVVLTLSMISDVRVISERSEETIDLPLAKLDSWLRAGALEEV